MYVNGLNCWSNTIQACVIFTFYFLRLDTFPLIFDKWVTTLTTFPSNIHLCLYKNININFNNSRNTTIKIRNKLNLCNTSTGSFH